MAGNGLRLVSFDCGAIRCLSQLKIVENIVHRIQYDRYPDDPDTVVLPCECFDAMSGSDTGGLIVIMFCKLRMSIEDTIEEFYQICHQVYVDGLSPEERSTRLRECIEDLLKRRGFPIDLKMAKDDRVTDQGCPCFVVTTLKNNMSQRINLRTYRTRAQQASKATVVEAMLASCATQPDFLPVSIGPILSKQDLVGGAMSVGNPCRELITEAYDLFGRDRHVATILSLGSGRLGITSASPLTAKEDWTSVLRNMANNCEQTAQEMKSQLGHLGIYYRFSVEHGLERTFGVIKDDVEWINAQTESYIHDTEVSRKIDHCVEGLGLRQGPITLEQLKHSGGGQAVYKGMPPLTSYFVLRKQPWEIMTEGLLCDDLSNERQKILVVSGMGGCGKTQLVLHFATEHSSRFKYSFFINASTKESIQADIIHHVRAANASYSQASFSEALNFFRNPRNRPSLLVYDNLDDTGIDLTALLPECADGVIIITTRNRSRGQLASPHNLHIELGVMSNEEAVNLILSSSRLSEESNTVLAASVIANELGNLPVALVQAGSYVHETACSCKEYLERLRSHKSEMMYTPAGDRQQRSAYKAFDISYSRLPVNVRNMLHIISCIHFTNFPLQAISTAAKTKFGYDPFSFMEHDEESKEAMKLLMETFCPSGEWDDYTMDKTRRALQNYSLATFSRSGLFTYLQMHPLVHEWAFERLEPTKRIRFQHAASRLIAAASKENTLYHDLVPHIDFLSSHAPEIRIFINDRAALAHVLGRVGLAKKARVIWEGVLKPLVDGGPSYEIHVSTVTMKLACTYDEDLEKMEKLEGESIAIKERLIGVEHIDTLEAKKDLAGTFRRLGRMKESNDLYIAVLDILKAKFEHTAPKVLEVMGWLAFNYYRQGRYSEAETIQKQRLEIQKEKLGDTHQDTLDAMRDLGLTRHSQCRYSEAVQIQEQVLDGRREQFGDTHINTINAMLDLGLTHYSQGCYSEAEALQEKVFNIQKEQLGDTHMNTVTAMGHLALTYCSQGRHSEAEALQEQVIKIRKEHEAHTQPETVLSMSRSRYYSQGRHSHSEVEALHEQILKLQKEQLGDTHLNTVTAMKNLASIYYLQSRYAEAEILQEQALKTRREQLGDTHPGTLLAMNNLSSTYHQLGRLAEAKELTTQAEKGGKDSLRVELPYSKDAVELLERIDQPEESPPPYTAIKRKRSLGEDLDVLPQTIRRRTDDR